MNEKMEGNVS